MLKAESVQVTEGQASDRGGLPPRLDVDAAALKALAHPLRVRIWEWLSVNGEATSSMLARELGESSGATSYHLRQLARFGFVTEVDEQPTARERWWRIYPGGWKLRGHAFMRSPDTRGAAAFVIGALQQKREDRYRRWNAQVDGLDPRSEAWAGIAGDSTAHMRMTPEETERLKHEVDAVLQRWSRHVYGRTEESRPDTETVEVQLNVFPNFPAAGGPPAADDSGGATG